MTSEEYLVARHELEGKLSYLDLKCRFDIMLNIGNLKDLMKIFDSAYLERSREVEALTRVIKRAIGNDFFKNIGGEELEGRFE